MVCSNKHKVNIIFPKWFRFKEIGYLTLILIALELLGLYSFASDSISKRENCLKLKLTKLPDSQEKNGLDEWLLCQWCQTISQLCTTSRLECKLVIIAWFYKYNWIYVWHQGALMWSERERNVVGPSTFKGGQNLSLHSIDFKRVPLFSLNTY